jgi:hypothetical protein
MTRVVYIRLLLLLGFVLGQSFALVHATQHELDGHAKLAVCAICTVSHSGSGPLSAAARLPPPPLRAVAPQAGSEQPACDSLCAGWVCRGPPRLMS